MFGSHFPPYCLGTPLLQFVSLTGHLKHLTTQPCADAHDQWRSDIIMASLTLTAKQQAVLLVLWPCLKVPPRIDVQIGPEGIRLGATFDRTAPGMVFDKVRSDYDQIAVAANLDVATVEVDFERLEAAAGLGSIEEAVDVWESIKEVVRAAASATPVSCPSRDSSKAENSWDIPKWVGERSYWPLSGRASSADYEARTRAHLMPETLR